jgi:GAF domain-containing protein
MSVEWRFLITLNEQLRPLKDPVAIQEVAVRSIGEHLHASRVNYALIDGDEFVVSRSYADGVPSFAGRGPVSRFGKAVVGACRRGETVAVDDVKTDPRFTDAEREQLLAGQISAFVGTPLIKDGRWLATFGVHSATPRTWTRDQIALVEVTAERTWGAGERARAEEALGRSESRQAFLRRLTDTVSQFADPAHSSRDLPPPRHAPQRQPRHLRRGRGRRLHHPRRLRGRRPLDGGPRPVAQPGREPHDRHPERLDAVGR